MGIGYFQLTTISENDKYIVGNPQFTYFKAVYKKHTNFAIENVMLNFTGETYMGEKNNFGKKLYTIIPKNADLVHRMYLVIELKNIYNCDNSIESCIEDEISVSAFSLIDTIEIRIGDQLIDKHTGEWLHIYHEIFLQKNKNSSLCEMIHTHNNIKGPSTISSQRDGLIYIPLIFWFNRNPGLSIPLLALQYSDVKIDIKFTTRNIIRNIDSTENSLIINKVQLLTEFIHLDTEEKTLFASNSHEYLIEQVQYNIRNNIPLKKELNDDDYESYQHKFDLILNHPVKEIFWAIQDTKASINSINEQYICPTNELSSIRRNIGNQLFNYWRNLDWNNRAHQLIDATIGLNGKEIFDPLPANFFMAITKHQYHSGFGYTNLSFNSNEPNKTTSINYNKGSGFYCYSFALTPETYQPSGSLNFSKLDKADLRLRIRRDKYNSSLLVEDCSEYEESNLVCSQKLLKMYAINYNILRIMSGNGGLAFQN